jgi:arabinofuranosyltransferase
LGVALFGAALLLAFRLALFGHLLPLSVSAKPALLANGFAYVRDALLSPRACLLTVSLVAALRWGGARVRVLVLASAAHVAALLLAGGDWMPGRRLFAPLVPVLALTIALGSVRWGLRRPRTSSAVLLALLLSSVYELAPELARVRGAAQLQRTRLPELARLVCTARPPVVAVDVGALGVACPEQTFVDLGGLTDNELAHAHGAHLDKRISAAWLARKRPGLLLLHSRDRPKIDGARRVRWFAGYPIERRVLGFAFVQAGYEVQQVYEYADDYFYVLLTPRR